MSPQDARARVLAGYRLAGGSATVPITNGEMAYGAQVYQQLGSAAEAPPAQAAPSPAGASHSAHNTSLHVGLLVLGAGAFILVFHLGGFRVGFDAGMGR